LSPEFFSTALELNRVCFADLSHEAAEVNCPVGLLVLNVLNRYELKGLGSDRAIVVLLLYVCMLLKSNSEVVFD
jgi:hypothetical protein